MTHGGTTIDADVDTDADRGVFAADLIVLAPAGLPVIHPGESLDLETAGTPHLVAGVRETTGIVGPLVVPTRTACLHCQHPHRHDADPIWPVLAMQMAQRAAHGPDPCDITLAGLVAALAAMQALSFLDRLTGSKRDEIRGDNPAAVEIFSTSSHLDGRLPVTANGTLELAVPDWRIRRRTWPVHPNCPCRTARSAASRDGDVPETAPS
jgi:hypothetical protein